MKRYSILFLALVLAASPLMAAGYDGHAHGHGGAGHDAAAHDAISQSANPHDGAAPVALAGASAPAPADSSADFPAKVAEDCEDAGPDHCCGDTGIACHGGNYLPGGLAGGNAPTAASAPLRLGHETGPNSRHPEYEPPPPRA
jgi:hypothetical protein